MLHIWYEYFSESYPRFRVYKLRGQDAVQQFVLHETFRDVALKSAEYPRYDHIFLLDESRFDFFRFDIFQQFDTPVTLQDLQNNINEKCEEIKSQQHIK